MNRIGAPLVFAFLALILACGNSSKGTLDTDEKRGSNDANTDAGALSPSMDTETETAADTGIDTGSGRSDTAACPNDAFTCADNVLLQSNRICVYAIRAVPEHPHTRGCCVGHAAT
ncbi:MAG: hypothetical protein JXR76_05385 [Deltaproteobacteria bacterium]|nr:hypothetical protein [Deltaproteobacteria bacterium]